jgi:hypothetical protein
MMNKKICRLTGFLLKSIIFTLFLAITIFTTCSLEGDIEAQRQKPAENNPPVIPANKTFIIFDNTQGICTVSVYEDYRRRDEDKIDEIPAGNNSAKIEWTPGTSVPFYFSYRVNIKDISGFILNYVAEMGRDQKAVRIDADITTTVKVPTLSETFSSPDTLLSNNSYLFIQNNSSFSFELHQGTSKIKPDNISSPLVNSGERAQYTINPGPASSYQLLLGATYYTFTDSTVSFEAGHIYIFDFNGSISLISDTVLKLENVNGITIPQSPAAPVVITSNGFITLQWTAVESATAYEIWMATVNDPASASKYGTDVVASLSAVISGLNNGTRYYFWLKAKNSMGTSGFSPVAEGIPTASTVKPPDPQVAPSVIAGNGQLTVSWQAVQDADVYEIWAGATNSTQTATKQGGDVNGLSAVITGLNNGTTYYVWIKAKNIIGISSFSPFAIGKPLSVPSIPGVPTLSSGFEQLLVTWTAVAGAGQYEVYYGLDFPTMLATTTTKTTATITGLISGTTYYVCLRAKNSNGISDFGPTTSGIPHSGCELYRGTKKIGNQELATALSWISTNAVNGDDFKIILGVDESVSPTSLNYSGKTVGITLLGYGGERTITLNGKGSMFTVTPSVTLTLDENITLVGQSTNNASLVYAIGGHLIMNNGAKIIGNNSSTGGGVTAFAFTMNGGEISGNSISYGDGSGGVLVMGTFTMNNGKISGNYFGGVSVAPTGTFTMNGGEISGNSDRGGVGVSANDKFHGTFTMNGGKISGNTASHMGGGVTVGSTTTFTMSGGEISGNTVVPYLDTITATGGGVYVAKSGTFIKLGGGTITGYASDTVKGNVVKNRSGIVYNDRGHAVYVDSSSIKRRETTAGPGVNLDSSKSGAAGGWEN